MTRTARHARVLLLAVPLWLVPPAVWAQAQREEPFTLAPVEVTAPWVLVPPSVKDAPKPPYPSGPRARGEQGTVSLLIQVGADGRVGAVSVKKSSGNAGLDEAAVNGVRTWTFVPARRGPDPVEHPVEVPIVFRLQ